MDCENDETSAEGTVQYAEPANAKTDYAVTVTVTGNNIKTVRKQIEVMFPGNKTVWVGKVVHDKSRTHRLSDAQDLVMEALDSVKDMRNELEELRNELPENLKDSQKSEQLDEALYKLQEIGDGLDNLSDDCANVKFPSMH